MDKSECPEYVGLSARYDALTAVHLALRTEYDREVIKRQAQEANNGTLLAMLKESNEEHTQTRKDLRYEIDRTIREDTRHKAEILTFRTEYDREVIKRTASEVAYDACFECLCSVIRTPF